MKYDVDAGRVHDPLKFQHHVLETFSGRNHIRCLQAQDTPVTTESHLATGLNQDYLGVDGAR